VMLRLGQSCAAELAVKADSAKTAAPSALSIAAPSCQHS
jgi:hypothetical protein